MKIGHDPLFDRAIVRHDGACELQVCASCYLVLGADVTTPYDAVYYAARHNPKVCPDCGGEMGMYEQDKPAAPAAAEAEP